MGQDKRPQETANAVASKATNGRMAPLAMRLQGASSDRSGRYSAAIWITGCIRASTSSGSR